MLDPHWLDQLQDFARLRDGWDSYQAPAPNWLAIATAADYLRALPLFVWEPTRVEASVVGGIGITHRKGARKVYVEFGNDGNVHALFSDRQSGMSTTPVGCTIEAFCRFVVEARSYLDV